MPGSIHLNRSWTAASVTGNPSLPLPSSYKCELTSVFPKKDETSIPHHGVLGAIHLIFHLTFWFISIIFYLFWTAAEAFILQIHCGALAWSPHAFTADCHIYHDSSAAKKRLLLVLVVLVTYFAWSLTHTWENSISTIGRSNPITGTAFFPLVPEKTSCPLSSPDSVHIVGYFSECVVWKVCTAFFVWNQVWDIAADS